MALTRVPVLFPRVPCAQLGQRDHDLIEVREVTRETLDVPKAEFARWVHDEHATELERIPAHRRLVKARLPGAKGRQEQLRVQQVKRTPAQREGSVRLSVRIDVQRERHPHLFPKRLREGHRPVSDGVNLRSIEADFFVPV